MRAEESPTSASVDSLITAQDISTDPRADTGGEHDSLKYHLLGPSLTKAGQDAVDQKKVRVI